MVLGVDARRSSYSLALRQSHRTLNARSEKSVLFLKERQNATPASRFTSRWETAIPKVTIQACTTVRTTVSVPDIPFNGNTGDKADIRIRDRTITVLRPEEM
jgi:hypothetical protein